MSLNKPPLFIEGAAGFVGNNILSTAIDENYPQIIALGRPNSRQSFKDRIISHLRFNRNDAAINSETLQRWGIQTLEFDGTDNNNLGLSLDNQRIIQQILEEYRNAIFVGAMGDVRFLQATDNPQELQKLAYVNVKATQNTLDYIQSLKPLANITYVHIGTAFDNGKPDKNGGDFRPYANTPDISKPSNFCNEYERVKAIARELVKKYSSDIRVLIANPSIVVGQSKDGLNPYQTTSIDGMYGFLKSVFTGQKLAERNKMDALRLPGNESTLINMVTVDKLAFHILQEVMCVVNETSSSGNIVNLTAPINQVLTYRQIMDAGSKVYREVQGKEPLPILISNENEAIPGLDQYTSYVNDKRNFGAGVPDIGIDQNWLEHSLKLLAQRKIKKFH